MSTEKKLGIIISIFILAFAYGIYNLFQPERFPISFTRGEVYQWNEEILFGPYPSKREMVKLKRIGVKTFINLMNPSVPFEGPLISEQLQFCTKIDVRCERFPLSFINPSSQSNLDQINAAVEFIQATPGKKYIHCYLGRHRVKLVQDRLEKESNLSP